MTHLHQLRKMTLWNRIDSVKSLQWFEPEDFLNRTALSQAGVTAFTGVVYGVDVIW